MRQRPRVTYLERKLAAAENGGRTILEAYVSTKAIKQFLQTEYDDQHLAALLAHAEDGKLSYMSCCCFVGIPTATHALQGRQELGACFFPEGWWHEGAPLTCEAEDEFNDLSASDAERRAKLIPLILAEMDRRASLTEARNKLSLGITNEESHSQASFTEKVFA